MLRLTRQQSEFNSFCLGLDITENWEKAEITAKGEA